MNQMENRSSHASGTARPVKEVIVFDPAWNKSTWQSFYIDREKMCVKPNMVFVRPPNMDIIFETNSHGFKGPEVDSSKKLVAVWGDSVVFAPGKGWVDGITDYFPGYQFLNGGLEGDPLEHTVKRAAEKNMVLSFQSNILFPGWARLRYPKNNEQRLEIAADMLPGLILCTQPTSLNEVVVQSDLTPYFVKSRDTEESFGFWSDPPYSIENARWMLDQVKRINDLVWKVASRRNIPVVDLYSSFKTMGFEDFRRDFFDAGHPRVSAFPKWHRAFHESLKQICV